MRSSSLLSTLPASSFAVLPCKARGHVQKRWPSISNPLSLPLLVHLSVFPPTVLEEFLGDRRLCYGQLLSVVYCVEDDRSGDPFPPVWLILEGDDLFVSASKIGTESRDGPRREEHTVTFRYPTSSSPNRGHFVRQPWAQLKPVSQSGFVPCRLHEAEEETQPVLSSFHYQRMLSNLTALRIRIGSGRGPGK